MRNVIAVTLVVAALTCGTSGAAFGAIIDFTGGIATLSDSTTVTTTNTSVWHNVDYYVENGFKLDFIGDVGIIGDYYGGNNSVIHGHWANGNYGTLTSVVVTKMDGTAFDLNYFILTSNTDTGGGAASGNEQTFITASNGFSQLLPTDDWGFAGTNPQIFLGSNFDNITSFTFTAANVVDCFGMDNFYIDEPAPRIPVPGSFLLTGIGLASLARFRKTRVQAA